MDPLDAVMAADRAWFGSNPDRRWRVRAITPAEQTIDLTGAGPVVLFNTCRFVLVLASPDPGIRTRYFFDDAALLRADPAAIWPAAGALLRARTTDVFMVIIRQNVVPIGEAAG